MHNLMFQEFQSVVILIVTDVNDNWHSGSRNGPPDFDMILPRALNSAISVWNEQSAIYLLGICIAIFAMAQS